MHRFLCALALLILAACAGDEDRVPINPVAARFAAASADSIEVTVKDPQPVETAELVAPDGAATEAYQIDRSKTVEEGYRPAPSVGVGVFGGSSGNIGTSIGIGFPLFGDSAPPRDPVIDSRVLIRVPDMTAYRAGWYAGAAPYYHPYAPYYHPYAPRCGYYPYPPCL